ncbi:phage infection protein [Lacticaseibacillus hegangensis]|uniref:Phage infection protein n=1 Tax=Lacticaseibacillus hegangensis TaxID=2486010 RepID=A0ABW4CSX8_9LACO|nr:phage infection protein [Lacticaseibacillus hegangensis]
METKNKILASFMTNTDGYIIGYQQEFFDGKEWQTPFDTTNAVEVAPGDLDTIVMGATKLINGKLVVDEAKQAELEAEANKVIPTTEQQLIAALMLKVAKLEASA